MRRQLVIGNWKMNTSIDEAINLIVDLKEGLNDESTVVCVPYTHIGVVQEIVDDRIAVGAQNLCQFDNGAYTGEISSTMLQSLGVEFVIVGHSERRAFFGETDSMVNTKVQQALKKDIIPVICCGEQLETRKEGSFLPFIENQIREALKNLSKAMVANCVIAYEPVWAIGTGETASPDQAQEMHAFIRNTVAQQYGEITANSISIVYGGSVKPSNANELFACSDIDGGLIGGASLDADSFIALTNSF